MSRSSLTVSINLSKWYLYCRLGLEKIYLITSQERQYTLHVRITDWQDVTAYAKYSLFYIGNEATNYQIMHYGYSGTAGDAFSVIIPGRGFTTVDRDNDIFEKNCARTFGGGGWWYEVCYSANPNGLYFSSPNDPEHKGIQWQI